MNNPIRVVDYDGSVLPIGTDLLPIEELRAIQDARGILLWCNEGLYGLVSCATLANLLDLYHAWVALSASSGRAILPPVASRIGFYETVHVPPRIAEALVAASHKQFGQAETRPQPPSRRKADQ